MTSKIAFDCLELGVLARVRFVDGIKSWPLHSDSHGTGAFGVAAAWLVDGDLLVAMGKTETRATHFIKYLTISRYGSLWFMCHRGNIMPRIWFEILV